ncbi:MAG: 4Fe-4S dicluster domain-containing protein [Planctomycetota bacterium]
MQLGFLIDNRKCIGCHACTVACKSEHDVPIGVNRTWVKQMESGVFPASERSFHVLRCNHCAEAPCVEICPVTALYTRPDGIVDFDDGRCIGCKACMQACPYDALYIHPEEHTAAKCNYCTHRVDRGLQPACVVACPEQAIVSGDLADPLSFISQLVATQPVLVRKPEKGTQPSLFYIEGRPAALDPQAASGAGRTPAVEAPQTGVLWGREVSGYMLTKAVASGVLFLPLLLSLMGGLLGTSWTVTTDTLLACGLLSLLMQASTAALLVADLRRPDRFLHVLFRGNPRSWLVRGAWILSAFGLVSTAWLLSMAFASGWLVSESAADASRLWAAGLGWGTLLLAPLAAVYTSFLLRQAKGRDLWQSPLQPVHMLAHMVAAGAAGVLVVEALLSSSAGMSPLAAQVLCWALILDVLLIVVECAAPHRSSGTTAALALLTRGPLAAQLWIGVVGGSLVAAALAGLFGFGLAAALLALPLIFWRDDLWLRAAQLVPNS